MNNIPQLSSSNELISRVFLVLWHMGLLCFRLHDHGHTFSFPSQLKCSPVLTLIRNHFLISALLDKSPLRASSPLWVWIAEQQTIFRLSLPGSNSLPTPIRNLGRGKSISHHFLIFSYFYFIRTHFSPSFKEGWFCC